MIDLGDLVPLAVTIRDADGAPTTAATVTLTITRPDGTTDTPAVGNPDTGVYTCDYQPTQVGRHTARWTSTGPLASYVDVIDVRDGAGLIVSLRDAKRHLNESLTDTAIDEELRGFIEAATPVVEDIVGPVVPRAFTEVHDGGRTLVLDQCPVVSITTVTGLLAGAGSYGPAGLDVDPDTGVVRRVDGGVFVGPLRVVYRAGREQVPANIVHGCLEVVRHMWETQRGHSGARPGFGEEEMLPTSSGFTVPRRVFELLHPHRKAPVVA